MAASRSSSVIMEAKGVQSLIKEIHGKLERDRSPMKVPSWKFPGRLAAEIDFEAALSDCAGERSQLLELLIDRFCAYTCILLNPLNNCIKHFSNSVVQ